MTLIEALQGFIAELNWEDQLDPDPERQIARLDTRMTHKERGYRLVIEADDQRHLLSLLLFNEITVAESRYTEALELANAINDRMRTGCICVTPGRAFRYGQTVDLEGVAPVPLVIHNMVDAGLRTLSLWQEEMGRIIFTRTSTKTVLAEIDGEGGGEAGHSVASVRSPAPTTVQ